MQSVSVRFQVGWARRCSQLRIYGSVILLVLLATGCLAWADPYPMTVTNSHPTEKVYVRMGTSAQELEPVTLGPGESYTYQVPIPWISGRIFGCYQDPTGMTWDGDSMHQVCGLVEGTVPARTRGTSFDISYVDYISIPAKFEVTGCKAGNPEITCDNYNTPNRDPMVPTNCHTTALHTVEQLKDCPTKLTGRSCINPRDFCADADNKDNAMCTKFADFITTCSENPEKYPGCGEAKSLNTTNVYGCSGFFGTAAGEGFCGAMNRGVFNLDSSKWTDAKQFYQNKPYNAFAKWTHQISGDIYAFPYDDVNNQSGTIGCYESTGVIVTFYPQVKKDIASYLGNRKSLGASELKPAVLSNLGLTHEAETVREPLARAVDSGKHGVHDVEVFQFAGEKGERAILEVQTKSKSSMPVSLKLFRPDFKLIKTLRGKLPLQANLILPSSGNYIAVVDNLPGAMSKKHKHFVGSYVLSLKSSKKAWNDLHPLYSVE